MPLREYKLDTGFDTNPTFPLAGQTMPPGEGFSVGNLLAGTPQFVGELTSLILWPQQTYERWQDSGLLGAAFRQENDVFAWFDLATRPTYRNDPSFDLEGELKQQGLWGEYRNNFLGVGSREEFLDVVQRIRREQKDRQTLLNAGPSGLVVAMMAGMLSPTVLLPFVGPGIKGAKAIALGASYGLLGGAAAEVPLQLVQETRSVEESAFSVAMSTVIGGVLGGAVGYLNRPLADVAAEAETSVGRGPVYIQPFADVNPAARPQSGGAAVATVDTGGLAGAGRVGVTGPDGTFYRLANVPVGVDVAKVIAEVGPVTRTIAQDVSAVGRNLMSRFSDAGVMQKGNVAREVTLPDGRKVLTGGATQGPTVENRIKLYDALVADVVRTIDDAFARYMLGKQGRQNWLERRRATVMGVLPGRTKMSKSEFRKAVGRAMFSEDKSDIPEVQEVAEFTRKTVYEPLYEAAQAVGIYKLADDADDELEGLIRADVLGDKSYLNRDYNLQAIKRGKQDFVRILAEHYQQKLEAKFAAALEKELAKIAELEQKLADFKLDPEEVERLRDKFKAELGIIDERLTDEEADLEDFIRAARETARDESLPPQARKDAREQVKILQGLAGADYAERQAKRKALKKRLLNLNGSIAARTKKSAAKLAKIEAIEENSLKSMRAIVRRGTKFLAEMESYSAEQLSDRITALRNSFAKLGEQFDRAEQRINKIVEIDDPALARAEELQLARSDRMTQLADDLAEVEEIDGPVAQAFVQAFMDEALLKVNRLNASRAARARRLQAEIAENTPERITNDIADLTAKLPKRKQDFADIWRGRGTDDVDLRAGFVPDFRAHARELAESATNNILGTNMRLPGVDMILLERGPELARVLDIPSEKIMDFLETDIERVMAAYVNTLAPDIELRKVLGEFAPDNDKNVKFQELNNEEMANTFALEAKMKAEGKSTEQIKKATEKLSAQYTAIRRDLNAVIGRFRHTWGIPKNPDGIGARMGRIALNLNVLRYMGMVTVSSLSDLGKPIFKYGLVKAMRSGYLPFVKRLATLQFDSPRELQLAAVGLDTLLHSRMHQISDIGDLMRRGTKFEKSLEWATGKIGLVALFDYWTTAMKQITGLTVNAQLMDDLASIMQGKGNVAKATTRLAEMGIDGQTARFMWDELSKPGGSNVVDGVLWPNTESWSDANGAVTAYRTAVLRNVDQLIVTPGVDRPLWLNATMPGRLLGQFQSFAFSSTTRTLLAGLQQRDASVLTGMLISLALGTVSYYLWAKLAGGKSEEDMEAALASAMRGEDEGLSKFADEAISRSGILGVISTMQDILSNVPAVAPYVTFSGEKTSRQAGNDLFQAVAGPTFGDLASTLAAITTGIDPAEGDEMVTKSWAHKLRTLMPLQNHLLFRQWFNALEEALPLAERRMP